MSIEFGHDPGEQLPADISGPRGESLGGHTDGFADHGITGLGFSSPHEDAQVEADIRFQQEQASLRASGFHFTALSRERSNGGAMGVGFKSYGFGADGALRPMSTSGAEQFKIEQQTHTIYKIEEGVQKGIDAVRTILGSELKQPPPRK